MGCRHSRPSDPSAPPPNPHLYFTHPNNPHNLISAVPYHPYANTQIYPSTPYSSHQLQTHPTFALPVSPSHSHNAVVRPPSSYPQYPPTSSTHYTHSTHRAPSTHNLPLTHPPSTHPSSPLNPPSGHHLMGSSLTLPSYRSRNTALPSYASNGSPPSYPYDFAPRILVCPDTTTHCSTDPVIAGVVRPGTPIPDSSNPCDRHPARRYPASRPVDFTHPAPLQSTNASPPEPAAAVEEAPAPAPAPATAAAPTVDIWAHYRASNLSRYAWLIDDPQYPALPPASPPQPTSPNRPPPAAGAPSSAPTAVSNDAYVAYRASNPVRYAPIIAAERRRRREWQIWRAHRVRGGDGRWWF